MVTPMKYKLIIFDFDGTLADSFPWFADNINKAAKIFRFKTVHLSDHEKLRSLNSRQIMSFLDIKWWKVPLISMYMRKMMSADLERIHLFDKIGDLLLSLKEKKIQLAIVSSNSSENVKKVLGSYARLVDHFECGSSVFGKHKKFQHLLETTGLKASEVLSIGDEIRDIEAAKAISMHTGSVTWGYAKTHALKKFAPDYVFSEVSEILNALESGCPYGFWEKN